MKHALKAMIGFGVLVSVVALRNLLSSRLVRHCCRHHYYIIVACEILFIDCGELRSNADTYMMMVLLCDTMNGGGISLCGGEYKGIRNVDMWWATSSKHDDLSCIKDMRLIPV